MRYQGFHELIRAYLDTLKGRSSHANRCRDAAPWILTLTSTPIRRQILDRHKEKGHGHFQPGAAQANSELSLIRAACRWGIYEDVWNEGDPTVGIRKWKTAKRKRTCKFDELSRLLTYFDKAATEVEIRDRALFGLMLFTGCRPSEARKAPLNAITPYGEMGAWIKGKTKTGENQELPLPKQLMPWIAAWKEIRPTEGDNPYLFPGQWRGMPTSGDNVRFRWEVIRNILNITGLWTYDLRRTLVCEMRNSLHVQDSIRKAIINHTEASAFGHYDFVTFDALTGPIQQYADWLWGLNNTRGQS
jgi:integrase